MKNRALYTFLILYLILNSGLFAQEERFSDLEMRENPVWFTLMQEPNPNFFEVERAYNLYFENRGKVRGSNYKQFERWAWRVRGDVLPDGSLRSPERVINSFNRYHNSSHSRGPSSNAGEWVEVGPKVYPINATGQETGTGRLNAIAFHPTDPDKFWIGAPSGGLWYTTDGGNTYASTTDQLPEIGVSSIVVDQSSPNIIYMGTGDRDGGNTYGIGVYKSTDGGNTWFPSNTGMGNLTVGMMIMDPTDQSMLLAATNNGIYKTTNSGALWVLKSSSGKHFKDIVFHPTDPDFVYATEGGKFYRSTDRGESWTEITSGLISCNRMVVDVSPDQPDAVLCLLTGGSQTFQGIFKSTDKGVSFSRITSASHPNILGYLDGDDASQAGYDLSMLIDPSDVDHILVGSINIHESLDGGVNFSKKTHWVNDVHADQHVTERNPLNGRIYEGHDGGLHYSDDWFTNFTNISSGINIAQTYKIGVAPYKREQVINGYQDNGSSNYKDGVFTTIAGGDGMESEYDYDEARYAYTTYIADIKRSSNGGYGSWEIIAKKGLNGIDESGAWVTPYMLHLSDPNTLFFGYKNIWRSNNVKSSPPTWTKISDNLGGGNSSNFHAIAQSPENVDVFFCSKSDNTFFRSDNINDGTPDWTDLTSKLPASGFIDDILCHPTDPEIVYLIQSDHVYKSIDRGNNWSDITGSLPSGTDLTCMVYDKFSDEGLYVGSRTGVFYKDASLSDWIPFDGALPVVHVTELEIFYGSTDSRLRAGTYGRGLWESSLYYDGSNAPVANFEADKTIALIGEEVSLTDLSAYKPTSWSWTITPATFTWENGTSAVSQHPEVKFTATGTYTLSLHVSNGNGSDSRTIESYIQICPSVTTPNCIPVTQNLEAYGMGIYRVNFEDIDYFSGQPYLDSPNYPEGYLDLVSSVNTVLTAGENYQLTVELGTGYTEYWNVYIDYNNDGDFEDADEEVYVAPAKVSGEQVITISTIANPQMGQLLRMRIICDLNSISGPCDDPGYGQAEDYGIIFKDQAQITTTIVSSITPNSAQSGGIISDQGGSAVLKRGVVWGYYPDPSIDEHVGYTEDGTGTGTYASTLSDLFPGTTYYVRAYAINSEGIAYGQNESFATLKPTPVLTTDDISNISFLSADGGGDISDDGGEAIETRGLVWDTSPGVSLGQYVGKTENGSGTGVFSSSIDQLFPNTTYYVKAYARNGFTTAYGSEKTFTTLEGNANQSRDIVFSGITTDQMDVSWINGNGDMRVVIINTQNSYTPPADEPILRPILCMVEAENKSYTMGLVPWLKSAVWMRKPIIFIMSLIIPVPEVERNTTEMQV
jgi:PKD repeat protein/photosystem II stability/assembly factor-like uncharacterized protein